LISSRQQEVGITLPKSTCTQTNKRLELKPSTFETNTNTLHNPIQNHPNTNDETTMVVQHMLGTGNMYETIVNVQQEIKDLKQNILFEFVQLCTHTKTMIREELILDPVQESCIEYYRLLLETIQLKLEYVFRIM
jgi:hypothetical protein